MAILRSYLGLVAMILFASACLSGDPTIYPGEQIVSRAAVDNIRHVEVSEKLLTWSTRVQSGFAISLVRLSDTPVSDNGQYIVASSNRPGVLVGDEVLTVWNEGLPNRGNFLVKAYNIDGRSRVVARSPTRIDFFQVQPGAVLPLLVWSSGNTVYWRAFNQDNLRSVEIDGVDGVPDLAVTPNYIFVGTHNAVGPNGGYGTLWRISRDSGESEKIAQASEFTTDFPRNAKIDNSVNVVLYHSGHLQSDNTGNLLWMVTEQNSIGERQRSLIVELTSTGETTVVLDLAYEAKSFVANDTTIYWNEYSDVNRAHTKVGYLRMWSTPRNGGESETPVEQLHAAALNNSHLYGVYPGGQIWRVPL